MLIKTFLGQCYIGLLPTSFSAFVDTWKDAGARHVRLGRLEMIFD